jgi:hypothetical protein
MLPNNKVTVETLSTKAEAHDVVEHLLDRNQQLEEIYLAIQPLLHAASVAVYGEDNHEPVSLNELIEKAVEWIRAK